MEPEEFRRFINETLKYRKLTSETYAKFSESFTNNLTARVIEYCPQAKACEDAVAKIATSYVSRIWDLYDNTCWQDIPDAISTTLSIVKKPETKEEAQQRLIEEIKGFPETYHKRFRLVFWEDYSEAYALQVFKHAIYEEIKKSMTANFLEDILIWDSNDLRYFDRALYIYIVPDFEHDIAELLDL